jgi:predicted GNAT family N-acyltransferase
VAGDPGAPAADRGRIGADPLATIRIVEVRTPAELEQAFAIRRAVFMEEQGVSEALEFDQLDDEARHLLAFWGGEAVGTLRLRWLDGGRTAKIERVAVLPGARGLEIGRALVEAALAMARLGGADTASLHAQTTVQGFYGKLGFVAFGPEFMEDGIAHIAMQLSLPAHATGDRRGRP